MSQSLVYMETCCFKSLRKTSHQNNQTTHNLNQDYDCDYTVQESNVADDLNHVF